MHHPWARAIAERLLRSPALGPTAAALLGVGGLHGDARLTPQVTELLMSRALALPDDGGQPTADPRNQAPLPEDGPALVAQFLPILADHPDGQGLGLVLTVALADLWPHLAHEERGPLRAALLAGILARSAPANGLSREQLRVWNRRLGTLELNLAPGLDRLAGVLEAATAEASYARLSAHLHRPGAQVAWILGSLVASCCDHGGATPRRLTLLAAAAAAARVADTAPADLLAILLAQLGHDVWQVRADPGGPPAVARHLEDAVLSADGPAAARAARAMAGSSPRFWAAITPLLPRVADAATLLGVSAVALRCRGHTALAPEDAAALAMAVAAPAPVPVPAPGP